MAVTSQLFDVTFWSNFFDVILYLFLLSDSIEICKSEAPPSEFCSTSGDWGKIGIPNLARTSRINFYWILQNARVTATTRKGRGGGGVTLSPSTQIRVKEMTQTQVFVNEWFQTTSRSPWHQGNFWKFN